MTTPAASSLHADDIVDAVRDPVVVLSADLRVQRANRSFYRSFNVAPIETEGRLLYELGNGQWNILALRTLLEQVLPHDGAVDDFEVVHDFPVLGTRVMLINARRATRGGTNGVHSILLSIEDVTERHLLTDELRTLNETLERRVIERTKAMTAYQQQLRSLVAELNRTEQRERQRVAADLHDNLAQLLAVSKMKVSALQAAAKPDSSFAREAAAVKQLLGESMDYTRALMADLRPDVLNDSDLIAAIGWIAQRMRRHGLTVVVEDDGESKPLGEEVLGLVFQSVRELLFNVVSTHRQVKQRSRSSELAQRCVSRLPTRASASTLLAARCYPRTEVVSGCSASASEWIC
jgi:signal transduction histidine kinase